MSTQIRGYREGLAFPRFLEELSESSGQLHGRQEKSRECRTDRGGPEQQGLCLLSKGTWCQLSSSVVQSYKTPRKKQSDYPSLVRCSSWTGQLISGRSWKKGCREGGRVKSAWRRAIGRQEAASLLPKRLMKIWEGMMKRGHEIFLLVGIQKTRKSYPTHSAPHELDLSDSIQCFQVGSLSLQSFPHPDKATLLVPLLSWFPQA